MISLYQVSKIIKEQANNELKTLEKIDLSIKKGEFIAINGPSGSGKTSLFNILAMIDRPSSGKYVFETKDCSFMSMDKLLELRHQKIGIVLQNSGLIQELTVIQNLALPLEYRCIPETELIERVSQMLDILGVSSKKYSSISELNVLERQQITIGQALLHKPMVLLADEPTGNLDSYQSECILNIFQQLNHKGMTIIMVTSDIEVARHAKRVILLADGKIQRDVNLPRPTIASTMMKTIRAQRGLN